MESKILDHGYVKLVESPANGDLSVVNAMLVSTGKNQETEMNAVNEKRINFLLQSDPPHASPFEHAHFTFNVKAPIFVARQWFRHRTGSFNEMSGRYKKLNPDFYIPEEFRAQKGKPGAYTFEKWDGDPIVYQTLMDAHNAQSVKLYNQLLDAGVAKEQARMVLPLSMYTEFYYTVSARNLMNFLRLRNSRTEPQYEIRVYAEAMEKMFDKSMPVTYNAWMMNERRTI